MVWQWRGTNPSSNHIRYSVYIYINGLFFCLWLLYVLWCMVLFQRTMVLKIFKENLVMVTPLRWSRRKQWFKMKEMLQNYLKKSDSSVELTLHIFFGIPAMIIIPLFVENYNLMVTLEVFIFSVWFGIVFYRHQLLKNND